ncbi:MAG: hypothetical protein R3F17_09135 [Planctomycetota bacterium]
MKKDEQLAGEGFLQILSSEEVLFRVGAGTTFVKDMLVDGEPIPLTLTLARRGNLVLELTLSNVEMDEEVLGALLNEAFEKAGLPR